MSFLFAFCCKSVIEAGTLDETYLICWALFAIADALWVNVILGRK